MHHEFLPIVRDSQLLPVLDLSTGIDTATMDATAAKSIPPTSDIRRPNL